MISPRRVALVPVREDFVLDAFAAHLRGDPPSQWLLQPRGLTLPPDCRVLGVHYDWSLRCFLFRVEHESFAEVPEGVETPTLRPTRYEVVESPPRSDVVEQRDAVLAARSAAKPLPTWGDVKRTVGYPDADVVTRADVAYRDAVLAARSAGYELMQSRTAKFVAALCGDDCDEPARVGE